MHCLRSVHATTPYVTLSTGTNFLGLAQCEAIDFMTMLPKLGMYIENLLMYVFIVCPLRLQCLHE